MKNNETDDLLDRILCSEKPLTPSPGFIASVMEAIHEQSRALQAIPFPWLRFAAGLIGGLLCLFLSIVFFQSEDLLIITWASTLSQAWMHQILFATIVLVGSLLVVRISLEFFSD